MCLRTKELPCEISRGCKLKALNLVCDSDTHFALNSFLDDVLRIASINYEPTFRTSSTAEICLLGTSLTAFKLQEIFLKPDCRLLVWKSTPLS